MVHYGVAAVAPKAFCGGRPQGDGTPGTHGQEDRNQVLGFEFLGAEPAANIGKLDAHLVPIKAKHRRNVIAATEWVLNRRGEFQSIAAHLGDAAPEVFHGMVEDAREHIGVFEDMVGLTKPLLDITPAKVKLAHQITRTLLMNYRRLCLQSLASVEDRWQVCILHLNTR